EDNESTSKLKLLSRRDGQVWVHGWWRQIVVLKLPFLQALYPIHGVRTGLSQVIEVWVAGESSQSITQSFS
ncbi:MAG: hypothetical protein ACKPKO_30305, partial [Candidatus Fonsibacter sp.]